MAHPAATIVLLREAVGSFEVLLLRRVRSAGFVPGGYVFPGGRVDPADADPEAVARIDGLNDAAAAARLQLVDADPPAIAYYLAAVREAFEETGILLCRDRTGSPPATAAEGPGVERLRVQLMEDRIAFPAVLERLGCSVAGDAIEYLAHWITPRSEPRRFDTRFFAASVPRTSQPLVDPREMSEARWMTPAAALKEQADGRLPMILPTLRTLEQLAGYASVDATLEALAVETPPTILPSSAVTPSDIGLRTPPSGE